ncbi:MAG: TIGR03643 family protein [Myxococcota bacterium]|nr:TIGR03643 family protein [Myxococcota bacterium]
MPQKPQKKLPCDSEPTIDEVVELAWRDEVTFDDIFHQTGLIEPQVIRIMRNHLKPSSFRMWRKRVTGRKTRHQAQMRPKRRVYKREDDS